MIGYKLTIEQANLLFDREYTTGSYFNPVTDSNGDYFIFEGEVSGCDNPEFEWVKQLTQSEYK